MNSFLSEYSLWFLYAAILRLLFSWHWQCEYFFRIAEPKVEKYVAEILFISYRKCFVSGRGKSQCVHQSLNLIFKDRWVCGGNLRRVAAVAFALCVEQNVGLAVSHNIFRHFFNGRIVEMHPNAVVMSVAGVMTV